MRIKELFQQKQVLSFEVFPPKRTAPIDTIYAAVEGLKDLKPDFISVTYGAGGSGDNAATLDIASAIKNRFEIESVAHLTGMYLSKQQAQSFLKGLAERGVENILALRGDAAQGIERKRDFPYAGDLISFIRENGDFNIIAACYPEGHAESGGIIPDIRNLKAKVDAGADCLITQMFFDNRYFYRFRERATLAGIDVPIQAGIMPVVNKRQIERMVSLCGVDLPEKFVKMMDRYQHNPLAMRDAGIAYAIDQIVDLIAQGIDGIHLYTMNNPYIARRIYEAIHTLIAA